jgi:DNA-binding MarR family transcriptional regulator
MPQSLHVQHAEPEPGRTPSAPGTDPFTRAFQGLVSEVFRLNGQLLATAENLARDLRVSPARWQTIATIRDEPLTVAEISRRLGLRRQSVQHNINQLLGQKLVELVLNPRHRRASLVQLTPSGRALMVALYARQAALAAEFTQGLNLGPEELEALAAGLRALRETAAPPGPAARRRRDPG